MIYKNEGVFYKKNRSTKKIEFLQNLTKYELQKVQYT